MQVLDYLQIDKPDPVQQTVEYRSAAKRNEDMPRKLLDRFPAFDHSPRPVGGKKKQLAKPPAAPADLTKTDA